MPPKFGNIAHHNVVCNGSLRLPKSKYIKCVSLNIMACVELMKVNEQMDETKQFLWYCDVLFVFDDISIINVMIN